MIQKLYKQRFEIFLATQLLVLFGSLFVPQHIHENILLPLLFLLNIAAGILLISKRKKLVWVLIALFLISTFIFGGNMISRNFGSGQLPRLAVYFIFNIIVTWNIIQQVWMAKSVNKNVITGLMGGYISLGFLAFFLFMSIELMAPGSFQGQPLYNDTAGIRADGVMYYGYMTLLTVGYGDIIPINPVAQKAAILVGLIGQFYMVIITAVVIEKYIQHTMKTDK